jgi:hypothetical protein
MKAKVFCWPFVVAVLIAIFPVVNILWELIVYNRLPIGWWPATMIAGWPAFTTIKLLVGYRWVPTNVSHMSFSVHISRWLIFILVNIVLWVFFALIIQQILYFSRRNNYK